MKPAKWYNWVALACAVWFVLTSWMWYYLFNAFFSYPFGLIALGIWAFTRVVNPGSKVNRAVFWLLIAGWLSSIAAALMFL